ncbi:MAG: HAD-IB family hydrolase [Victivallaceae bacterium]|nr:HAD-IB family hydrolase [Victivallaceae bacterium]
MGIRIAIFDMDHTLIGTDSDWAWKQFAVGRGLADASALAEADRFMAEYDAGTLEVRDFLRFQWREFAGRTVAEVEALCRENFAEKILPHCRKAAFDEVEKCRRAGMQLWILTSTCRFLATPVAEYFGIGHLYGAEIETRDGRVTDRLKGVFPCGEGKVAAAREIAAGAGTTLRDCRAYGDSINDLPLLAAVGEAVAVNPSPALLREAQKRKMPVVDWERER